MEYEKFVLDALEIRNGPAHGEVMLTPDGPCLVEVGARPHGGEGSWVPLVNQCLGTSQVKASVDLYLDEDAWDRIPDTPTLSKLHGLEFDFVSQFEGKLVALPKLDQIRKLESFFAMDMFVKPGEKLVKTIDCITMPGSVRLLHRDRVQLEADFLRLRALEDEGGFYILEGDQFNSSSSSSSSGSSSTTSSDDEETEISSSSSSSKSTSMNSSESLVEPIKERIEKIEEKIKEQKEENNIENKKEIIKQNTSNEKGKETNEKEHEHENHQGREETTKTTEAEEEDQEEEEGEEEEQEEEAEQEGDED